MVGGREIRVKFVLMALPAGCIPGEARGQGDSGVLSGECSRSNRECAEERRRDSHDAQDTKRHGTFLYRGSFSISVDQGDDSRRLFHLLSGFDRQLDAMPARKICSIMPEKNVLDNLF